MAAVKLEKREGYIHAVLSGELTLSSSNEIKTTVKEYLEAEKNYALLVDMEQVELIDSSGLGVLISWFKLVNQEQGKVIYAVTSQHVRKIIGFAKLDKIFTLTETVAEAENLMNN